MKPIPFKHANRRYGQGQPQYRELAALNLETPEDHVISCWKLTWKEKLKILFTGKVWLVIMKFGGDLQPSYMSVNRKDCYSHTDDKLPWRSKAKKYLKENFQKK